MSRRALSPIRLLAPAALALLACGTGRDLSLGQQNNNELGGDSGPGNDAGPPLACQKTVDTYCGDTGTRGVGCNYAKSVQACAGVFGESYAPCGQYDVLAEHGVDTGSRSYYDHATGNLVAVIDWSANGGGSTECVAGPASGFVEPTSCGPYTDCTPTVDAGAPDAAAGCSQSALAECNAQNASGFSWPPHCYADFASARAACTDFQSTEACGAYDVVVSRGVDTDYTYYYDHATGALTAILYNSIVKLSCVGGPSTGFQAPACGAMTNCTSQDGGSSNDGG